MSALQRPVRRISDAELGDEIVEHLDNITDIAQQVKECVPIDSVIWASLCVIQDYTHEAWVRVIPFTQ